MNCINCSKEIKDSKFCPYCGVIQNAHLLNQIKEDEQTNYRENVKGIKITIILTILLLILFLGVLSSISYFENNKYDRMRNKSIEKYENYLIQQDYND